MSILFTIPAKTTPWLRYSSHLAFVATTSPPTHNVVSLFLLNECHLSPPEIAKVMKTESSLLRTRSPHTAREAVLFMRDCGFTQTQLHSIILRYPQVIRRKVDHLKPLFELLTTLGFATQYLPILLSREPRLLGCSVKKDLSTKIPFLENIYGSKQNLFKALKYAPGLLTRSVEKQIKPKLDLFKQLGIEGESLSLLLSIIPNIFTRASTEQLQTRMQEEYVVNTMGISKGSKPFVRAICVLVRNGPEIVEKKMKHLQSLGLLEDEVHKVVKKDPWLLGLSTKKMLQNMEFLRYTAGLQPNIVLSNPILLHLSVDKRLRPRHAVVRALHAMQKSMPSLPTIFKLSEKSFLQKFVECDPQASLLKEIYKGKVNSIDVETT